MTFIPVPGVAQLVLKGTVSGHPFANIFHYSLGQPGQNWTAAQLNSICNAILAGIAGTGGIASLTMANAVFQTANAVDLGIETPAVGASSHAAVGGVLPGPDPPPSTCVLVDSIVQDRYRGGHPRSYMPPGSMAELDSNEDAWLAAYVGQYQTAFENMQDSIFSAVPGCFQVVPRYNYTYTDVPSKHKYLATRESFKHAAQVVNWLVKSPIGTQRRRARTGG
jgi:hypothetical protein